MGFFSFFSKSKSNSTSQPVKPAVTPVKPAPATPVKPKLNTPIQSPVQPVPVQPVPVQPVPVQPVPVQPVPVQPVPVQQSSFNINKLKGSIPDTVLKELPDSTEKFKINTVLRLAHFISQCSHESGNFKIVRENLNYSAEGLLKVFPKYFTTETAKEYANQPSKIANKVYANRMGNNESNGFLYSGKGFLQLTGFDNYKSFRLFVDDDIIKNPDMVATKYPLLSAAWFFYKNNLFPICDEGPSEATIIKLTKRINGGTIGINDRMNQFNKFYKLLS